jgi:hypothetical protein
MVTVHCVRLQDYLMNKTIRMLTAIAGLLVAVTGLAAVFLGVDSSSITIWFD